MELTRYAAVAVAVAVADSHLWIYLHVESGVYKCVVQANPCACTQVGVEMDMMEELGVVQAESVLCVWS